MRPEEIDRIVKQIDATRRAEHFRNPDRPDARVFKPVSTGQRVPKEIVQAQGRCRSAAWRVRMDSRAAPDSREIGMALVHAVINTRLREMTWTDKDILARALMDLHARGFSVVEAKRTLRRIRNRHVDPADRQGEEDENCGPALRLRGEPDNDLPF